jgi:hypothetical protein
MMIAWGMGRIYWWFVDGCRQLFDGVSRHKMGLVVGIIIAGLYLVQFGWFWRFYSVVYPQLYASQWQDGYQQMVEAVNGEQLNQIDKVFITREQGRPAMYYWFYSKTDPRLVQAAEVPQDQGEFLQFENISFIDLPSQVVLEPGEVGLVASSPQFRKQLLGERSAQEVTTIENTAQEVVWSVYLLE